jgi:hypothetical protein
LGKVKEALGAEQFFDLRTDPGELRKLAGAAPGKEVMLRGEMARWLAVMEAAPSPVPGKKDTIDGELEEKLRALGNMR